MKLEMVSTPTRLLAMCLGPEAGGLGPHDVQPRAAAQHGLGKGDVVRRGGKLHGVLPSHRHALHRGDGPRLHMAALGGTWLTAVFGFAGLSLHSDEIAINPKLPTTWRNLGFAIEWRGRRLKFRIDADHDLQH